MPIFGLFLWIENRQSQTGRDPLVDLRMFRNPVFSIGLILVFLFYWDSVFFLTFGIFLQSGLHWTPLESGMAILPFGLGAILGPSLSPALIHRIGNYVLVVGFSLLMIGFGVSGAVLFHAITPGAVFYFGLLLAGMGHGIVLPSGVRIIIGEVEPARAGLASGIATSILQIGAAFGATVLSGVFFTVLSDGTEPIDYARAYQAGIGVLLVLFVVCFALSFVLARQQGATSRP